MLYKPGSQKVRTVSKVGSTRSARETSVIIKRDVSSPFFPSAKKTLGLTVSHSTGVFNEVGTALVNGPVFHVETPKVHYKAQILLALGHVAKALPQGVLRSAACHMALPCFTQNRAELNVTD